MKTLSLVCFAFSLAFVSVSSAQVSTDPPPVPNRYLGQYTMLFSQRSNSEEVFTMATVSITRNRNRPWVADVTGSSAWAFVLGVGKVSGQIDNRGRGNIRFKAPSGSFSSFKGPVQVRGSRIDMTNELSQVYSVRSWRNNSNHRIFKGSARAGEFAERPLRVELFLARDRSNGKFYGFGSLSPFGALSFVTSSSSNGAAFDVRLTSNFDNVGGLTPSGRYVGRTGSSGRVTGVRDTELEVKLPFRLVPL